MTGAIYLLTELINLSPLFVTLYVFSAYLNLIVFEKIKLDLEQAQACFSVPNHCKITKCFNFKKYLTEKPTTVGFLLCLKKTIEHLLTVKGDKKIPCKMKLQGTFVNGYGQARRNTFSRAREQRGD